MILFKRVNESFRQIEGREWALLFLETLGVLVGILLAFELQEWAASRSDAAKHRQLIERLFEESEGDVTSLRKIRSVELQMAANERQFAVALSAGQCTGAAAWGAVSSVRKYPPVTVPSAVYDELMGAGGLSSIEDPPARTAVQRFRGYLDLTARQSDAFRAERAPIVDIADPRITVRYDTSVHDPEIITYNREALCGDRAFRNRMIDNVRDHGVILSRVFDLTDDAIAMCATLGRLVGRKCVPPDAPLDAADQATARKALATPIFLTRTLRGPSP
jgi:hypothetical protein